MSKQIVVIGAGIGGLAAAIRLAAAGHAVTVFEALPRAGGKAGIAEHDGVTFDTGPTLLTMPEVFDDLFRAAGTSLAEQVRLVDPLPAFRYLWPDGAAVDLHRTPDASVAAVSAALGSRAGAEFERYLAYTKGIWEAANGTFVSGSAPTLGTLLRMGPATLAKFAKIDPMRSMKRAVDSFVSEPHLRDICLRFATYNGSDPRVAPATLNCIGWVELGLGGWGIDGGLYALVSALEATSKRLGVAFVYGQAVAKISKTGGRADGVVLRGGEAVAANAVVVNADAAHLYRALLPEGTRPGQLLAPSTSGMTVVLQAEAQAKRAPHTVLFPSDYGREFADMFDRGQAPEEPTLYLCAQSHAHGRSGWATAEPVFAMANAPAEPLDGETGAEGWVAFEARMLKRGIDAGLLSAGDAVVWRRSPRELAATFPDTRGALYGAASNDRFAAFRRPANSAPQLDGLFLASGSAHPGGGLPLCALSGRRAAVEAASYLEKR